MHRKTGRMRTTAIKYQNKHQNEVISFTSGTHFFTLFLQKRCQVESSEFRSTHNVSPYNQPFTFTGKEKDAETGFSYFGARYYDSDLSGLFLSVDPLADKYPSISPYAYCVWNPVRLVDPDGCDIWELDNEGNVVNRTTDNERDVFYIVDENGNRDPDMSISFDHLIINTSESNPNNNYNCTFDSYEINGDDEGKLLFEFLSENTCVEWSHFVLGEKNVDECNIITTSHIEDSDKQPFSKLKQIRKMGIILREYNHCHQNGDPRPSGTGGENGDLVLAGWIIKNLSSSATFNIYTPGRCNNYHSYNTDYCNELRPVTIIGKKP